MLKQLLFAAMILAVLSSCSSNAAFKYNQDFAAKEKLLIPNITSTETNVARYIVARQFDSVAVAGEKMEGLVDEQLNKIKKENAPDAKGGEEFKTAGIKYFQFLKDMYTSYKNYGGAKTEEGRNEELSKMQELVAKKSTVIQDIKNAQITFASANNFRVAQ